MNRFCPRVLGVAIVLLAHLALTYRVETTLEDALVSIVIVTVYAILPIIFLSVWSMQILRTIRDRRSKKIPHKENPSKPQSKAS